MRAKAKCHLGIVVLLHKSKPVVLMESSFLSESFKIDKHQNRIFDVYEPEGSRVVNESVGIPYGQIYIRETSDSFQVSVRCVGNECAEPKTALSGVSARMLFFKL